MDFGFLGAYLLLLGKSTVLTLELAFVALVLGGILGFSLALARLLGGCGINLVIRSFVDLIRGIPVLVQLLAWYLGSAVLGLALTPFTASVVGLSVAAAVFISEIFRGAIAAVPRGQREAALALGLGRWYSVLAIELPQALPAIVPALMGFYIGLVKDTSLAYVVGLYELTKTAAIISEREFRPLEVYLTIAGIYFLLCFPLSLSVRGVERRLGRTGLTQTRLST